MFGVLLFDTLPGLIIGIAVSMLLLLYRVSKPHVAALAKDGTRWVDISGHPDLKTLDGVVVVRVEAGMFFANADHVRDQITGLVTAYTTMVVLDAETSPFIDVSAAQMLAQLRDSLARRNVSFRVARDIGQFRDVLSGADQGALKVDVYPTVSQALAGRDNTSA